MSIILENIFSGGDVFYTRDGDRYVRDYKGDTSEVREDPKRLEFQHPVKFSESGREFNDENSLFKYAMAIRYFDAFIRHALDLRNIGRDDETRKRHERLIEIYRSRVRTYESILESVPEFPRYSPLLRCTPETIVWTLDRMP